MSRIKAILAAVCLAAAASLVTGCIATSGGAIKSQDQSPFPYNSPY